MSDTNRENENLWLWDRVKNTDPEYTKPYNNGSFKGTDVDIVYNIARATELMGPVGIGWGWEVLDEQVHTDEAAETSWVTIKIGAWIKDKDGNRSEPVIHYGSADYATSTNKGYRRVNKEAHKMAMTNALGKVMSMWGFSADVYMGRFDDAAYVDEQRRIGQSQPFEATNMRASVPEDVKAAMERLGQAVRSRFPQFGEYTDAKIVSDKAAKEGVADPNAAQINAWAEAVDNPAGPVNPTGGIPDMEQAVDEVLSSQPKEGDGDGR